MEGRQPKWTQDGLCRYVDEKKITEWSNVARVYFPIDELNSAENKILTKSELVNSHTEVEQRNVALETSEERNMTELKTYHTLKEDDVKNLEIISDEDFSDIVDSIILNDYKNIPNTIRLPNINSELAEKLGLEKDSAFIMKKSATHIRPDRKGSYGQALDTEEYRMIPKVMRDATFAYNDPQFLEGRQPLYLKTERSEWYISSRNIFLTRRTALLNLPLRQTF